VSRRAGLDRAAVVREAAALADGPGGLDGLSLARLAARLGVRVPSLYNHIEGLDALRRELGLRGLRELSARLGRAAIGRAAGDAIVAFADAYRTFAHDHPGLYAASLRASPLGDEEWRAAGDDLVGIVLAILAAYDLRDDDALHAVRGLRSTVHGFVALEAAGGFGLPLDLDESYRRLIRTFVAGLQRDRE